MTSTPQKLSGGEAIAHALVAHDMDTVFGVPGAQIYGLFDGFASMGSKLRVLGARHEQTTAYMALGYARSTGRPSAYAVVPGPGMLNTTAALATAYGCNAPVLCLTGQVPSTFLGRGRGHLHELPDQLAVMSQLTKWAGRIEYPGQAGELVSTALQQMRSQRQGPAALEAPWDFFTTTSAVEPCQPLPRLPNPPLDTDRISAAAKLLANARAPMIMVGGGASEASEVVRELAEYLDAPVVAFRSGRGVLDDRHDLSLTLAGARALYEQTDVLIGIGTRLEVPQIRYQFEPRGLETIRIDVDPAEMRRLRPTVGVVADAVEGTTALLAELRRQDVGGSGRRELVKAAKLEGAAALEALQPQMGYLRAIRDVLPDDGILVDEMCQAGYAAWLGFPVYGPRSLITSGYQGTLGYGFPTALGVKVANPDRQVISINGDGGFLFAMPELATAVQYGIGVIAIVFNNNSYGNVRRDQESSFGGRLVGADLVNPDFVSLGEAFGVWSRRVASPEALRRVLAEAMEQGGPALIEVPVERGSEPSPWGFIHPPRS